MEIAIKGTQAAKECQRRVSQVSCQDTRFKALEHTSTERSPTERVQPAGEGSDKEMRMTLVCLLLLLLLLFCFFNQCKPPLLLRPRLVSLP